jgi:outer membrane protein assembly factor BamB
MEDNASPEKLPNDKQQNEAKPSPRRRSFPWWCRIGMAVECLLAILFQTTNVIDDRAIANIATQIVVVLAIGTPIVWFLFAGRSRMAKRNIFALCVLAIVLLAAFFHIDRVGGGLIPKFSFRFGPKPDRRLDANLSEIGDAGSRPKVDLLTTTNDDFPQFLGPSRSSAVGGPRLARDWSAKPPRKLWRQPIGAGWSAFSVVNGHAVTMEQRGDREMTTCYDLKTGRLEWANAVTTRFETTMAGIGPRSTPTIDQGKVFSVGANGRFACLDGATGHCLWEKNLRDEVGTTDAEEAAAVVHGRAGSPLIVGDLVVVPGGGPAKGPKFSLLAYRKQTGELVWKGGNRQISYSSPAIGTIAGVEQILIVNEDYVSGHDLATGKVLWEDSWPGRTGPDPNVSQPVPLPPDRVFLSKGYGRGAAVIQLLPQDDGTFAVKQLWDNRRAMKTKFCNVSILDGFAYGLSDGVLQCLDVSTGASRWKDGDYRFGQILRSNDLLLVLSESGEMVLVEAKPDVANHVLGRFQAIEGMTWNNIALAGPYLVVRNAEEAACYELPLEPLQ